MSMLDSFFNKGFKGPKCKTLLKLTIPRIKLLRNRREIQIKQMRRDIAKLLETGQEATARIRVEHIVREENMMAAQEIIELFCELIAVRIPIIEVQRECPLDLKEAISSVCFAAPRCADLPELMHVQMLFASKFGKEFVGAATELRPDCGVNRKIIELLSVRAPAPEKKLELLKEIAEAHGLDWDPSSSESEIFKQPEDLLNGPSQFTPLPKEKHEETLKKVSSQSDKEQYDSDSGFDELAFPEVPKVLMMRPIEREPSMPQVRDGGSSSEDEVRKITVHHSDLKQEDVTQQESRAKTYEDTNNAVKTLNSELLLQQQQQSFLRPSAGDTSSLFPEPSTTSPSISKKGSDMSVDLQDVLAAAHAAADSAERAASAARSAASLAQVRISELVRKKNEEVSEFKAGDASPQHETDEGTTIGKMATFSHRQSFGSSVSDEYGQSAQTDSVPFSPSTDEYHWRHPTSDPNGTFDDDMGDEIKYDDDSTSSFAAEVFQPAKYPQQPERCASLDDDPDFSYPNLFSSNRENVESGDHSIDRNFGSK